MLIENINKYKNDPFRELEKVKRQLFYAENEFNNVCGDLQVKAAIFRLCELEARRDLIIKEVRK